MKCKKMSRYGMKLALGRIIGPKRLLALDIGTLTTGVAISCPSLQKTYLLKVVKNSTNPSNLLKKLENQISHQQNIVGIIIGKPISQTNQNKITNILQNLVKTLQIIKKTTQQEKQLMYCYQQQNFTTLSTQKKIKQILKAVQYHGHIHDQKILQQGIPAIKILDKYLFYYNQK